VSGTATIEQPTASPSQQPTAAPSAACGDGLDRLAITADIRHPSIRAGQTVTYAVRLKSTVKNAALELKGLALRVVLPEGARYRMGKVLPRAGQAEWKRNGNHVPKVMANMLTWPLSSLGRSNKRTFLLKIATDHSLSSSTLTIGAFVFQPGASGTPICTLYAKNATVGVRPKGH
jgi:hypothetical protein